MPTVRTGLELSCPRRRYFSEEIAWRNGYIDTEALLKQADALGKSGYGTYLKDLVKREG